jgi:nucleotide-binding universal stress UspA family protein
MAEIVVGVDGSPNSLVALLWAQRDADLRHVPLVALFAWGYLAPGHAGAGHTLDSGFGREQADERLAAAVRSAVERPDAVELRTVHDAPDHALRAAALGAELLVVGARSHGRLHGWLSSVSTRCLHHLTGPLAIVRSDPPGPAGAAGRSRVVVGVDPSPSGQRAFAWAVGEARLRRADLDPVRAWEVFYPAPGPATGYSVAAAAAEADARDLVAKLLAEHGLTGTVLGSTVHGPTASALLRAGSGADLVVLGTSGHGRLTSALLGSVTHQLAHHASCTVVVVP